MTEQDQTQQMRINGGEHFFQLLFENSADAYLILQDNRFVDCNQATVEMLRADSKEEVLATHPSELSPEFQPDGRPSDEKADEMIAIALERGSNRFEWIHRRLDGEVFPVEVVLNPLPADGKAVIHTIWRDITERKQVETAIRESEQRLFLMIEQSPLAVIEWNLDFEVTSWNPAAEAIFGYTSEEAIGQHAAGLIVPEEARPIVDKVWSDLLEQEGGNRSTNENMTKDGCTIVCEWYNTPLIDPDGNTIGVVSIVEDITEQKEAEQELQLTRTSIEKAEDAFFWFDADANFVDVSERTCEVLGYSREELFDMQIFDVDPAFPEEAWPDLKQQVQDKGSITLESQHQTKDGRRFPVQVTVSYLEFEGEEVFFSIAKDITERKEAEQELQLTRTSIEKAEDAFFWFDADANFADVSERTCEVLGYSREELLDMQIFDVDPAFPEEAWPDLKQQVQDKGSITLESQHQTKDGRRFPVQVTVSYLEFEGEEVFFSIAKDITERKEMEAQIQETFERRGEQVQLSTEIAQEIATATELGELFEQVVNLTKESLGYYHTQLLQYDPGRDAVVLVTGYGETGEKMLAQDHQMPMGSGLIGTAAATGETVMRPTLADDPDWQPNPLLPETRGEVAVPIKLRDEVLGVLDVQSGRAGALTDDDRLLLEGLCGQIAIAIDQTRLRQEMEEQLNELNSLYRAMSQEGWKNYRQRETLPEGFAFDQLGVKQIDPSGLTAELFADVPMVVPGGHKVGTLAVQSTKENPLYQEEQEFVEQVAEQVALALESARLFEQAQTSAAELNRIFSSSLDMIGSANLEGYFVSLNPAWGKVTGYTEEELMAKPFVDFVHKDDIEATNTETARMAEGAEVLEFENRYLCKDGVYRWISWRATPDLEAGLIHFVARDVTDRKKAEERLREISELQSAILEGAEYGIIATLPDGTLTAFNPGAENMLGYSADEVVEKHDPGIFHDIDEVIERAQIFSEELGYEIEPGFEVFVAKARQDLPNEHEWTYIRKDGSRFPVLLNITALRDEDGKITGFLGIASDITERKAAQEAVVKRAAELSTVAEVGTTVSSLMDPAEMLQTVVDLTKERFDLYHAHIYLLDADEENLTLMAGAGQAGRQMVEEGWQIPLDAEQSLVAQAAREREGVISNDIQAEPGFMPNPLLPDTASELSVPLVIGDQLLGVLDVQSDQVDNFTDADVSIKTTLASQVAVALQNVRTYTRTQQQAEHETLINLINQQIQSTTDIEAALQVAVRELGRALGAKKTSVQLGGR